MNARRPGCHHALLGLAAVVLSLMGFGARSAPPERREGFSFEVAGGGEPPGCSTADGGQQRVERTYVGSVLHSTARSFDLDLCSPLADCAGRTVRIRFSGPGLPALDRHLVSGAYVRARVEVLPGSPCQRRLLLESVERWEGTDNPSPVRFFFAGNDGPLEPLDAAPFLSRAEARACSLRIRSRAGEVSLLAPPGSPVVRHAAWRVWNGSASRKGDCQPGDWNYWVTDLPQR